MCDSRDAGTVKDVDSDQPEHLGRSVTPAAVEGDTRTVKMVRPLRRTGWYMSRPTRRPRWETRCIGAVIPQSRDEEPRMLSDGRKVPRRPHEIPQYALGMLPVSTEHVPLVFRRTRFRELVEQGVYVFTEIAESSDNQTLESGELVITRLCWAWLAPRMGACGIVLRIKSLDLRPVFPIQPASPAVRCSPRAVT
jgi:hypothetical protein